MCRSGVASLTCLLLPWILSRHSRTVAFGSKKTAAKILTALEGVSTKEGATEAEVEAAEAKVAAVAEIVMFHLPAVAKQIDDATVVGKMQLALGKFAVGACVDNKVTLEEVQSVSAKLAPLAELFATLKEVGPQIDDATVVGKMQLALDEFAVGACVDNKVTLEEVQSLVPKLAPLAELFPTLKGVGSQIDDATVVGKMQVALGEFAVGAATESGVSLKDVQAVGASLQAAAGRIVAGSSTADKLKVMDTVTSWQGVPLKDYPGLVAAAKRWDVSGANVNAGVGWFGTEPDPSKWAGVEAVDADGQIVRLYFGGFKGVGATLPAGIGGLTQLTYLSLEKCSSLTSLPAALAQCTKLTYLDLRFCTALKVFPDLSHLSTTLTNVYTDTAEAQAWKRGGFKAIT